MKISEKTIHIESVKRINHVFSLFWPEYMVNGKAPIMHPASGEKRNARTGLLLKLMNVIKGYPDLLLDLPRCGFNGLRIEIKRPKTALQSKGRLTKEQKAWQTYFKEHCNIDYVVLDDMDDIVNYVMNYMENDNV